MGFNAGSSDMAEDGNIEERRTCGYSAFFIVVCHSEPNTHFNIRLEASLPQKMTYNMLFTHFRGGGEQISEPTTPWLQLH